MGGYGEGDVTLVNVRHSFEKSTKVERLVLDLSRGTSGKGVERPGFFHIAIQKNPPRVVIDLQNVTRSKVNEQQVTTVLRKAHFFSKALFYEDQRSKDLTIELPMKSRAKIEVFELVVPGKPGRIVLDTKAL